MTSRSPLVTAHLENLAGEVFEYYPDIIRDFIRGHAGVYALYNGERLYYVGLARDLAARVKRHQQDRHRGEWDRFSVYLTVDEGQMRDLESLLIRVANPTGNRQRGKFTDSESFRSLLRQRIKEKDLERHEKMLGRTGRGRPRSQPKTDNKIPTLALKKRIRITGVHKGYEYNAFLRRDGQVVYGDYIYSSPTAAAQEIVDSRVNGWRFWKYRDRTLGLGPIARLRN